MGEVIGLIGSIACLGGLIYSLYRIHVVEKRLSQYEEKENRDGECLERVEK